jgi:hypothetical protein
LQKKLQKNRVQINGLTGFCIATTQLSPPNGPLALIAVKPALTPKIAIVSTLNSSMRKSENIMLMHVTSTIWMRRDSSLASLQVKKHLLKTIFPEKEDYSGLAGW